MLKTDIKEILRDKLEAFADKVLDINFEDEGTYADVLYEDLIDDEIEEFYEFIHKLLEADNEK